MDAIRITEGASVASYDDARRLLYCIGYGAVRYDADHLAIYDVNPDATFAKLLAENKRIETFTSLFVPKMNRRDGMIGPAEKDVPLFEVVARMYVDEGRHEYLMGEENTMMRNAAWEEVVDATQLFELVCRRIDPDHKFKGSNAVGRGRNTSDWNEQYFAFMVENVELLEKFGIELYARDRSEFFGKVNIRVVPKVSES
jgi:hypothetical protein